MRRPNVLLEPPPSKKHPTRPRCNLHSYRSSKKKTRILSSRDSMPYAVDEDSSTEDRNHRAVVDVASGGAAGSDPSVGLDGFESSPKLVRLSRAPGINFSQRFGRLVYRRPESRSSLAGESILPLSMLRKVRSIMEDMQPFPKA